jgi:N,N'-diacetyllegionaminate synthase
MRVLGLVTARGGSKGFPGKNVATIAGRPLVAWAHRALDRLRAHHPELILRLSTDDPEIAAAWPEDDRPADLRPAHLSTDTASSLSVVEYELERLARLGTPCDAVLLFQPTSPLVDETDLEQMWRAFMEGSPSVIGAARLEHPIQWCFGLDDDGVIQPVTAWSTEPRTAHRAAFRPIGFYMCSVDFLRERRAFAVPGESRAVVTPLEHAIDIDYPMDLDLAACHLRRASGERVLEVGGRRIARGEPAFVIAEIGVNHNGDPALARELIDAAAGTGADAVKFQTFKASRLVTRHARMAAYQRENLNADGSQEEMLRRLELPEETLAGLKAHAESRGVVFLSSPFDLESARVLKDLGVDALKLGSGELTNAPMLRAIAGLGLPLIMSTGMATLDEVEACAELLRDAGDPPVAWLHCVSAYPAPPEQYNVRAMDAIRVAVGGPVGISDHTRGWEVTLAAVALGASVIEKHLTLSRDLPGPDHKASLEPGELAEMVRQVRTVEAALGSGTKIPAPCEIDTMAAARKSLVAARDLRAGATLAPGDIEAKRPGTGISPMQLARVEGRTLRRDLAPDEPITWDDLA